MNEIFDKYSALVLANPETTLEKVLEGEPEDLTPNDLENILYEGNVMICANCGNWYMDIGDWYCPKCEDGVE